MNRKKPPGKVLKKPICTWLNLSDYAKFKALADANKVTLAQYLRGIIIDALDDETTRTA